MNLLITENAMKDWGLDTEDILLGTDGKVYLKCYNDEIEVTNLTWKITYTPCTKEVPTIIITQKKDE